MITYDECGRNFLEAPPNLPFSEMITYDECGRNFLEGGPSKPPLFK
jgi:hypothetical protein